MTELYDSKTRKLYAFDHLTYLLFQEKGFQKQCEDDIDFAHGIHKIAALAIIHPNDVINAFADLSVHLGDAFQIMLDYLEDNYIGRFHPNGSRAQPLFNIEYWNVYERTKNQKMRTNNSAKAWNRRISKCINIKLKYNFYI
ncbi:unnamed protein product [Rotaria sp. Silwood2]|nr:unnamed protein product [Rotaria sp. Silwood2]